MYSVVYFVFLIMLCIGLRHKCNSNNDCEDGMVCQFDNNRTIGVSKFMSSKTKLCLCDNDNGYVEDILHDICSGGELRKGVCHALTDPVFKFSGDHQTLINILCSVGSLLTPFVFSMKQLF